MVIYSLSWMHCTCIIIEFHDIITCQCVISMVNVTVIKINLKHGRRRIVARRLALRIRYCPCGHGSVSSVIIL